MLNRLFYSDGEPPKLSPRQCVNEMMVMEEKYPGIGWEAGAEQLRIWLDKKEERERNAVDKGLKEIESQARAELAKEAAWKA